MTIVEVTTSLGQPHRIERATWRRIWIDQNTNHPNDSIEVARYVWDQNEIGVLVEFGEDGKCVYKSICQYPERETPSIFKSVRDWFRG